MGIIVRQSIKSSIVSYIGVLVGYVNAIILFPAFFQPEQFGLTRVLIAMSFMMGQFSKLGIHNVIIKLFPYLYNVKRGHHGFLFISLLIPFIGFLFFSGILFLLKPPIINIYSEQSPLVANYFYQVLPLALFVLYIEVFESYMRANLRITVPILTKEVIQRFLVTCSIVLFLYNIIDFSLFIDFFVGTYGISLLILIGYVVQQKQFYILPKKRPFTKRYLSIIFKYGVFSFLGGLAGIIVNKIDIIMLSALSDLEDTAIYSIGFMIATVIQIPQRNMNKIAMPVISKAWKDKHLAKIQEIYSSTSINQLLIGLLIFICIWINIDDLFQWMPKSDIYSQGKSVILLIAVGRLVAMAMGANNQIIETSKQYRFNLYARLLLVVITVSTNLILIPIMGIEGAALATAISLTVFNLLKFIFIFVRFQIQPFSISTIKLLAVAFLTILIGINIPGTDYLILNIILRSIIVVVLYSSLVLGFNISQDATNFFWQTLRWLGIKK